jgi:prefoldin subunit 5
MPYYSPLASADETLEDLESKYEEIENRIEQNEKELANVQSDIKTNENKLEDLESQIGDINEQIDLLDEKMDLLNEDIDALNESIDLTTGDINKINGQIADIGVLADLDQGCFSQGLPAMEVVNGYRVNVQSLVNPDMGELVRAGLVVFRSAGRMGGEHIGNGNMLHFAPAATAWIEIGDADGILIESAKNISNGNPLQRIFQT